MPRMTSRNAIGNKCEDCPEILSHINGKFDDMGRLRSRCKDCYNIYYRASRIKSFHNRIKYRFEMTPDIFNKKKELQLNGCAICKQPCKTGKNLAVDHNHITNEVRDLLCANCNMVLGLVYENEDILINMIEYLKKHSRKIA